jgi:hypothetical protein
MVGTVHDISYAAITTDVAFSQAFFPTYGILAWFDSRTKSIRPLPGADDPGFVQTDPSWRLDGKVLVFAKTETLNQYHDDISTVKTHIEMVGIHALNKRFPVQFNLYSLPFNNGRGGVATPIKGASHNDKSNYFGRYSPDGRWIVFTQSDSGIMLQPDSALYIVPAKGGVARRMRCNQPRFNSWHSFSPNGRWLLFSSKARSPFTEIYLTHIDEEGNDTPPVRLARFSDAQFAANVPEFVNIPVGAIERISLE